MDDRAELIAEITEDLVAQLRLVGPTPTVSERLRDDEVRAQVTGEQSGQNWKAMLAAQSRPDSTRGPRPSATLDHVILGHLEYLAGLGIEPNRWVKDPDQVVTDDGCEMVAEAVAAARRELIDQGIEPGHLRLPMSRRAVRQIWDRRRSIRLQD